MSNPTVALKITAADVAAKLKLDFTPSENTWRVEFAGHANVDGESIYFEVYGPHRGSHWHRAPAGEDPVAWDRAEIRVNRLRFRRSKARGGDFDWIAIGQAFAARSQREKTERAIQAARNAHYSINEPLVAALLAEFPSAHEHEVRPSRAHDNKVLVSLGTIEVSPATARIILAALHPRQA